LAEVRAHRMARQSWVYGRLGHIPWLNLSVKRFIRLVSWVVLFVLWFEMTIGFTGLTFLYWVYRRTFG
jgi:hypothetical protein